MPTLTLEQAKQLAQDYVNKSEEIDTIREEDASEEFNDAFKKQARVFYSETQEQSNSPLNNEMFEIRSRLRSYVIDLIQQGVSAGDIISTLEITDDALKGRINGEWAMKANSPAFNQAAQPASKSNKVTALLRAAARNNFYRLSWVLLRLGANPNETDSRGISALGYALINCLPDSAWSYGKHAQTFNLLIKHGAKVVLSKNKKFVPAILVLAEPDWYMDARAYGNRKQLMMDVIKNNPKVILEAMSTTNQAEALIYDENSGKFKSDITILDLYAHSYQALRDKVSRTIKIINIVLPLMVSFVHQNKKEISKSETIESFCGNTEFGRAVLAGVKSYKPKPSIQTQTDRTWTERGFFKGALTSFLYHAAQNNMTRLGRFLIWLGADPNDRYIDARDGKHYNDFFWKYDRFTPLSAACGKDHVEFAEMLLDNGAERDAYAYINGNYTALGIAIEYNSPKCQELLFKLGARYTAAFGSSINLDQTPKPVTVLQRLWRKDPSIIEKTPELVGDISRTYATIPAIGEETCTFERDVNQMLNEFKPLAISWAQQYPERRNKFKEMFPQAPDLTEEDAVQELKNCWGSDRLATEIIAAAFPQKPRA